VASRSALTEEGRTRIRNFSGRLNSYLVLWVFVGVIAVVLGNLGKNSIRIPALTEALSSPVHQSHVEVIHPLKPTVKLHDSGSSY
jgi:hypothetical protein